MSTEETIPQARIISGQISAMAYELQQQNAEREFESIWTKSMELPGMKSIEEPAMKKFEFLKTVFKLYFTEAYFIGAVDAAARITYFPRILPEKPDGGTTPTSPSE